MNRAIFGNPRDVANLDLPCRADGEVQRFLQVGFPRQRTNELLG
jgi:hypothetical protein